MESMENSAALSASTSASTGSAPYTAVFGGSHAADQEQRRKLFELFEACVLTDVVLVVQDQVIAAHRVVLATASPFFHALFTSGMKESFESRIELNEIHAPAFRELVKYMYLGQLHITGETILAILHTANQLEMLEVVEICCKQLMLELNVANCVDIYLCCENLKMRPACRMLAHAARAMIETYFCDVYRTDAFKNLPLYGVIKILLRRKLRVQDDAAVLSWLMHDPKTRKIELTRIFSSLQISEDPSGLKDTAAASLSLYQALSFSGMINSKDRVKDRCASPASTSITPALVDSNSRGEANKREPPVIDEKLSVQPLTPTIFVIGGFNGPSALKTVEYLDFHTNEWFAAANMLEKRSYSGVVVSDQNKIFVIGGTCSSRHLKSMEMYDPERNTWTVMPPMRRARSYLGSAYSNGYIYVVGGFNGMSHLNSVERFDVQNQTWEEVQPLGIGRSGLAVVAMNGHIYAIGGYDGRKHLKSVEVYDPRQNQWFPVASMRYARNGPAAVAQVKINSILVYGGESRHGIRMNTSERLDLTTGMWHDIDAFVDSRSGHVAFSFLHDSFLFCLGGSNKKDEYLDTVHRYDHLTKQWNIHSRMLSQRCGLNVAVAFTSPTASCFQAQKKSSSSSSSSSSLTPPLAPSA
uniref:BTB domain-containing protein n=1 Tax=Globisporangium ultimum (strain ATCC 200006 / CBS 805.95 / DAOM BR144) TaxID=431595 RepID=K3X0L2_GLOUD